MIAAFLGAANEARRVVSQYHLSAPSGHSLEQALSPEQYRSLQVRWRIVQQKLAKTLHLCDVHRFQPAVGLAATISGDVTELRLLLARAIRGLQGYVACEHSRAKDSGEPTGRWFTSTSLLQVLKICAVALFLVCASVVAFALFSTGGGAGVGVGVGAGRAEALRQTRRLAHSFRAKTKAE